LTKTHAAGYTAKDPRRTAITPEQAWVALQRLVNGDFVAETKFI
jgi:hypothetical protein